MATSSAGMFRTISFKLLGAATLIGGVALVLSNGLRASVGDSHPNGLAGLAKDSTAAMRQKIASDLALSRGAAVPLGDTAVAARLLGKSPLDSDALTYLALAAEAKRDTRRTRSLMELALRSDGRALRPRIWLIDQAVRHRDYVAAVAHLDRLIMVNVPGRQLTIKAMTGIVRDPASHAPLAKMLATNPPWRHDFIYALNQQGISPDAIFGLTARNSAQTSALFEQSSLLQSLLKNHEYERAYLAWINFLPEAQLKQVGTVYDPGFANLPGPLPFNWQLMNGQDGAAEFRAPRGLTVSYLGSAPAVLAQQTLLLSPGRYRLSIVASGQDEYNQLSWTVSCTDGGRQLQTARLTNLASGRRKYSIVFEVPATGCQAQQLVLTGAPGEFPKTATADIDTVQIDPAT